MKAGIRLDDARAGYGPIEVLHGVSVSFPAGSTVAVLGRNGSGKSTLLHTLAGTVPAHIRFDAMERHRRRQSRPLPASRPRDDTGPRRQQRLRNPVRTRQPRSLRSRETARPSHGRFPRTRAAARPACRNTFRRRAPDAGAVPRRAPARPRHPARRSQPRTLPEGRVTPRRHHRRPRTIGPHDHHGRAIPSRRLTPCRHCSTYSAEAKLHSPANPTNSPHRRHDLTNVQESCGLRTGAGRPDLAPRPARPDCRAVRRRGLRLSAPGAFFGCRLQACDYV